MSGRRGSNPRHLAWKARALPTELLPQVIDVFRGGPQMVAVEGEGFEPSKPVATDLQSVPFDRSGTPPRQVLSDDAPGRRAERFAEFSVVKAELAMGIEPAAC